MKLEEKSAIVAILINLVLMVVLGPFGSDEDKNGFENQIKNLKLR